MLRPLAPQLKHTTGELMIMFLFNFNWNSHVGLMWSTIIKQTGDGKDKIITESLGLQLKSVWGWLRYPKQANPLLCWAQSRLLRGNRNKVVLDSAGLKFQHLPLANTWIYKWAVWGWGRAEVSEGEPEASSRSGQSLISMHVRVHTSLSIRLFLLRAEFQVTFLCRVSSCLVHWCTHLRRKSLFSKKKKKSHLVIFLPI